MASCLKTLSNVQLDPCVAQAQNDVSALQKVEGMLALKILHVNLIY